MSPIRALTIILVGTAGACSWQSVAVAADLVLDPGTIVQPDTELPAVSGINGKWEFNPAIVTGSGQLRASGSISAPLGDRFGLQADGNVGWGASGLIYGAGLHTFTRDPARYLAGVTAGFVVTPNASIGAAGFEGELYLDQFSFEGWAGVAGLNYVNPAMVDKLGFFAIGDLAYYPTEDWRLAIGGSYVLGDLSLHAGTEYLLRDLGVPLSLTADTRIHSDGNYKVSVGLKGYFGADDGKSLIRRHREDDPQKKPLDVYDAAGSQMNATPPGEEGPPIFTDPEASQEACEFFGGTWDPESSSGPCIDPELAI